MNTIIALVTLVAYILIHANKAKLSPFEWVKANVMTTIVTAAILLGSLLIPKAVLVAVLTWSFVPMLTILVAKGAWHPSYPTCSPSRARGLKNILHP